METEIPKEKQKSAPPDLWLGLEDYYGDPAFRKMAENEFLSSPLLEELSSPSADKIARRDFLKLMGASFALATAGCMKRPAEHIIPYAQAPADVTPGIPNYYASTWSDGQEVAGILVKTLEGRPIKIEGNPDHPLNKGGLMARAHAEVLSLYDPDRLKGPTRNLVNPKRTNKESISTDWEKADAAIVAQLKEGGVAVLTSPATLQSPSLVQMLGDFAQTYGAKVASIDSTSGLADLREATRRAFSVDALPQYSIDRSELVVSIDADFLGTYYSPAELSRQYAQARKPGTNMLRLVSFDSNISLTALNADDRFRIMPSQQLPVVVALIAEISALLKTGAQAQTTAATSENDYAAKLGLDSTLWKALVHELWDKRGRSLVIAGGLPTQTEQGVELQLAVMALNQLLGNWGKTIQVVPRSAAALSSSMMMTSSALLQEIKSKKIKTLIIHDINPLYTLPNSAEWCEALSQVKLVISTSNWNDETASAADYVLPAGTSFESWADFELRGGVWSIQQPTIRPLHDSRSFGESLHKWTASSDHLPSRVKAAASWYAYLRTQWNEKLYPRALDKKAGADFEDFWVDALQTGFVRMPAAGAASSAGLNTVAAEFVQSVGKDGLSSHSPRSDGQYELVLYPSVQIGDGRLANISWLQELPDPVTKIVWDNYLNISPRSAEKEGLKEGQIVQLKIDGKFYEFPVHIQPGLHDSVVSAAIGYGRTKAGRVGNAVGVNVYPLVQAKGERYIYAGRVVEIHKTDRRYELATTQGHHQLEGRHHVIETTQASYLKNESAGLPHHEHALVSFWPDHQYNKSRWGMAIDLNTCTGCSACMIACMSENNIPTVGKKYILQGREMHWIRIDRYYKGSPETPEAVFQPMLCQQCENAPCETVCPVLATVHNDEGLNDMVYNRCVGTRYCANNCPYKVRRFNWFSYEKREAPLHMALNPDVSVRSRGVMEKCTFCVHRIRETQNAAKVRGEAVRDGEIQTACQQSCPTQAIVFGDLNDPQSRVSKVLEKPRHYGVLEELNTRPRVRYLTRIRVAERNEKSSSGPHAHEVPVQKGQTT